MEVGSWKMKVESLFAKMEVGSWKVEVGCHFSATVEKTTKGSAQAELRPA